MLTELVLLIVLVLAGIIARRWWLQRQDNLLRENPPARRCIEICLPRDVTDAREKMQGVWRSLSSSATSDKSERKRGERQVSAVYWASVPEGKETPELRFLLYVDPDRMDKVKKSIRQSFENQAEIIEHQEDPLLAIAKEMRPPEEEEGEAA